jgi:4-hydroxyacetophenone monooxygenase
MEPRQDRIDDRVDRSQAQMRTMVWPQPSITHSFHGNAHGEVYTLSPWRPVDYWPGPEPDPADVVLD